MLLPDGRVLVAGGARGTQPNIVNVATAELFDFSTGTWTDYSEHVGRSLRPHINSIGEWSGPRCGRRQWRLGSLQRPHEHPAVRFERWARGLLPAV